MTKTSYKLAIYMNCINRIYTCMTRIFLYHYMELVFDSLQSIYGQFDELVIVFLYLMLACDFCWSNRSFYTLFSLVAGID